MIKQKEEIWKAFKRKRSWRASEKAMAMADLKEQIEALEHAIRHLDPTVPAL